MKVQKISNCDDIQQETAPAQYRKGDDHISERQFYKLWLFASSILLAQGNLVPLTSFITTMLDEDHCTRH
jgi:hypothetical protein